ncbi:MAG: hypothetical protein JXN60_05290 [Lentisphaerae bacterium]|nr:hypothetical protein [Lentisphaerota bacterium]
MNPETAFEYLKRGFDTDRLAQAYVVEGNTRGNALDLVAKMTQLIFCETTGTVRPCLECRGCRNALTCTHPDIHWVEPQKKSRKISIDQVRNLQRKVYQTAYSSDWKVCVIAGADCMTAEAANAFLKTLEEPPGKSLFLLLTDRPQALLPTIVSRCQRVCIRDDNIVLRQDWYDELMDILANDNKTMSPMIRAIVRGERLTGLLKKIKNAAYDEEVAVASDGETEEDDDTIEARTGARYREWRSQVVLAMLLWYRDILILTCGSSKIEVHYSRHIDIIKNLADTMTYRQALNNIRTIEAMNRQMDQNIPEGAVMNLGFCRLAC